MMLEPSSDLFNKPTMNSKQLFAAVLLFICIATVVQPQNPAVREAKPEEIPFAYNAKDFSKVEIESVAKAEAEGLDNFPVDSPAYSCFHLKDARPLPALDKGPRYFYPAYSAVCIIPLTDASVTDYAKSYPNVTKAAAKLRKLLTNRPRRFKFYDDIFDLPYNNSSGAILSRVEYLSFKSGKGVLFLTQYSQDMLPSPVNNEELTCVFQGLSDDGKYYVAARLAITHPSLPRGIDFDNHIKMDKNRLYLRKAEQSLNKVSEDSFSPSLIALKALIASITTN